MRREVRRRQEAGRANLIRAIFTSLFTVAPTRPARPIASPSAPKAELRCAFALALALNMYHLNANGTNADLIVSTRDLPISHLPESSTLRYWSLADWSPAEGAAAAAAHHLLLFARAGEPPNAKYRTLMFALNATTGDDVAGAPSITPVLAGSHHPQRIAWAAGGPIAHNFATLVVGGSILAVGGQHDLQKHIIISSSSSSGGGSGTTTTSLDGVFMLEALNLTSIVNGSWLHPTGSWLHPSASYRSKPAASVLAPLRPVLDNGPAGHPGCIDRTYWATRREVTSSPDGVCGFDGKLSLVHHRGRFLIYARANLQMRGGRFLQLARTERGAGPSGPFGKFELIRLSGREDDARWRATSNIYFGAVKQNVLDTSGRTLLGLFPIQASSLPNGQSSAPHGGGYIGLALSCDGLTWGPLTPLATSGTALGRARDHPVDGLLVVKSGGKGGAGARAGVNVHVLVHKDVPMRGFVDASLNSGAASRLLMHQLNATALRALTATAHASLPGCRGT